MIYRNVSKIWLREAPLLLSLAFFTVLLKKSKSNHEDWPTLSFLMLIVETKARRMASINLFDRLPPVVPAINVEAWKSQSNISQKLNRLLSHLDAKSSNSELTKTRSLQSRNRSKSFARARQPLWVGILMKWMQRPLTPLKNGHESMIVRIAINIKFFLCF